MARQTLGKNVGYESKTILKTSKPSNAANMRMFSTSHRPFMPVLILTFVLCYIYLFVYVSSLFPVSHGSSNKKYGRVCCLRMPSCPVLGCYGLGGIIPRLMAHSRMTPVSGG